MTMLSPPLKAISKILNVLSMPWNYLKTFLYMYIATYTFVTCENAISIAKKISKDLKYSFHSLELFLTSTGNIFVVATCVSIVLCVCVYVFALFR